MKKLISYSVFLFYISFSFGQNRVSGYVVDNNSNLPIENVAIYDNYSDKMYYTESVVFFDFIKIFGLNQKRIINKKNCCSIGCKKTARG